MLTCKALDAYIAGLPIASMIALLLPCLTLWRHAPMIARHPEIVVFLPVLLTHSAYMSLGAWTAMQEEPPAPRRDLASWAAQMRYHLPRSVHGSAPYAFFLLLVGLVFPQLRPFALVGAFSILLATILAILLVSVLVALRLNLHGLAGSMTATSLFGLAISSYLLSTRALYREE